MTFINGSFLCKNAKGKDYLELLPPYPHLPHPLGRKRNDFSLWHFNKCFKRTSRFPKDIQISQKLDFRLHVKHFLRWKIPEEIIRQSMLQYLPYECYNPKPATCENWDTPLFY